jgi:hypothetical protein
MAKGTVERKCLKGQKNAEGCCSASCLRWYPRIEHPTPNGDGRRRFDYLGGYPTKAAAQSALDQACRRRHDNLAADRSRATRRKRAVASGPAAARTLTVNQLLDSGWPTSIPRARSVYGRSAATTNSSTITSAHTWACSRSARCPPCRSSA